MEQLAKKKELIEWLLNLEDDVILNKINELKQKTKLDFEKEFNNGLTMEEFRTEIKNRINTYSLKK